MVPKLFDREPKFPKSSF